HSDNVKHEPNCVTKKIRVNFRRPWGCSGASHVNSHRHPVFPTPVGMFLLVKTMCSKDRKAGFVLAANWYIDVHAQI
ncbi:MAG: hypothetical protein JXR23_07505, partial [Pontiellaceae bacterium]|nr:hypothetical protein [Pontiellaceae bacterium]